MSFFGRGKKIEMLLSGVVAFATTLFIALSARAEFTCELSFPSAPATALENFPVLVRLAENAPTGFSYTDCPTGANLWFTDSNDVVLPFEVDTWDTTSNSLVWVSVPSLSNTTIVTMHWSATAADAPVSPDSTNVWSRAGYVGVWHMNEILEESSTGKHYTPDSSASGWHAYKANESDVYPVTISNAGIAASAPPTGRAIVNLVDANARTTGGFIVPSSITSSTTIGPFTISCFEATVVGFDSTKGHGRVVAIGGTTTGADEWQNGCLTANTTETYVMCPNNGGYANFAYSDGLADNAWRHIAGVYNSSLSGYIGGVYKNLNKTVNANNYRKQLAQGIGLGTFVSHAQSFCGNLDEIRIRNVASTGAWVAEEYATVANSSYVTFSPVDDGQNILTVGSLAAADIGGVSATISGKLFKLGAGATSAEVWLVLDGGGETRTIPLGSTNEAPATLQMTLTGLTPLTTYTCYLTATNNAAPAAGVDSDPVNFTTLVDVSEWDAENATFSTDGLYVIARVNVTRLCSGTTTIYLMTGNTNDSENTISASVEVSQTGPITISGEALGQFWATDNVYYSLKLVSDTQAAVVTNWPCGAGDVFYNKSFKPADDSTYKWIGGSDGVWTNTANWQRTVAGNSAKTHPAGIPVAGSTAIFERAEGAGPITVTIPDATGTTWSYNASCWYAAYLNLDGMHEPLVFTSENATNDNCRFVVYHLVAQQTYNRLVFDSCNVIIADIKNNNNGAAAADANGDNFTITVKNGSTAQFTPINLVRPGVKIRVETGSTLSTRYNDGIGGGGGDLPTVLELDDTVFSSNGRVEPDTYINDYQNGLKIRLLGAGASFSTQYFQFKRPNSTNVVEFVIPPGGYTAAPLKTTKNDAIFANGTGNSLILRVAKGSPGLATIGKRGTPLVQSAGGINAANVRFEDVKADLNGIFFKDADGNEYADAAAIETAGKTAAQIKQIWYRHSSGGFAIIVR